VTQLLIATAAIYSIYGAPEKTLICVRQISTSKHRPSNDPRFVKMLATAKPGDIICIASPDRLARRVDDAKAIIRYCEENGLMLITAAVGKYVGAPAFVLSAGYLELADDKLLKDFQAAVLGFQGIAEVFADDKAVYGNEWRTMTMCV
jgi:hypothetical protein